MAEMYFRWECPLRVCPWAYMCPEDESLAATRTGGQIRDHIESHDPLEWVQELIDLRPVPVEVQPLVVGGLIRRRPASESLTYLADKLCEADELGSAPRAAELVHAVEISLRVLAMEADGGDGGGRWLMVPA
jgi:hypothetical protein